VLRLVARNNRVEAVVVPPEEAEAAPMPTLPPGVAGLLKEAEHLQTRISVLRDRAAPLSSRKAQVMAILTAPDSYDDRPRAHQLMDEVTRIEGVIDTLARLEKSVNDAHDRLSGGRLTERELQRLGEVLASLDGLACHAEVLVACRDPRDLGDALLVLSRTTTSRDELDGVGRLAAMYRGLATRHRLDVEVLDDHRLADPPEDVVVLQVTGAGAFALLRNETGLHQLTQGREEGAGRSTLRELVRVEALPIPVAPPRFPPHELRSDVKPLRDAPVRLLRQARFEVSLTHLPSKTTLRAWVDRPKRDAVAPLLTVLHARLESAEQHSRDEIVRRYTLGPAPLVRDERSGRRTGRLEEVLAGDLDLFFTPNPSGNEDR
jgi:peptide chain release factor 1